MVNNPDSIYSRGAMKNSASGKNDGDMSSRQRGGKEIAQMLDFDKEPQKGLLDKEPLSFMDVVYQIWGKEKEEEGPDKEGDE